MVLWFIHSTNLGVSLIQAVGGVSAGVTDLRDAVAKVTELVVDGLQLFLHVLLAVGQDRKLTAQAAQHMLYPTYKHNSNLANLYMCWIYLRVGLKLRHLFIMASCRYFASSYLSARRSAASLRLFLFGTKTQHEQNTRPGNHKTSEQMQWGILFIYYTKQIKQRII